MPELRFIQTEFTYADFSTSVSPAIELALERGESKSTVLLNLFRGGSFTVGALDDPEKSIDLAFCKKEGIVVRRRQNAGGAVWGPDGGAMIVLYVDTSLEWVPLKRVGEAFQVTLTALERAIREIFDIQATYRPLNDIEVEGRKLIATSARLEKGILTMRLLINVVPTDQSILKRAIFLPPEKVQDKKIKDAGARFTCLEAEASRKVTDGDLIRIAEMTVHGVFGKELTLAPSALTERERQYASEYQKTYTSDAWFYENSERVRFKQAPPGSLKVEGRHKAKAGLIRVILLVLEDRMADLILTGDFHPSPYGVLRDMETALRGKACDEAVVEAEIQRIFHRPDVEIAGTEVKDFVEAFKRAFEHRPKTGTA